MINQSYLPWATAAFLLLFILWLSSNSVSQLSEEPFASTLNDTPPEVYQVPQYKKVYNVFEHPYYTDKHYPTSQYYLRPYVTNEPAQYQSIYRQPKTFWPLYGGKFDWLKEAPYFGDWGV